VIFYTFMIRWHVSRVAVAGNTARVLASLFSSHILSIVKTGEGERADTKDWNTRVDRAGRENGTIAHVSTVIVSLSMSRAR
jgi:hypothetical protein